jgi:hypothetical protein
VTLLYTVIFVLLGLIAAAVASSQTDATILSAHPVPSSLSARVQELVQLKTAYTSVPVAAHRPQDLYAQAQDPHLLTLGMSTPLIGERLKADTDLTYTSMNSDPAERSADPASQALRLGLSGAERRVKYGMTYRSAGRNATVDSDRESEAAWMTWQSGIAAVTSSIEQRSTNVARDVLRPRTTTIQKRLAMDLAAPRGPSMTVAYTEGSSSRTLAAVDGAPLRSDFQSIETAVNYRLWQLQLHAASNYALAEDALNPSGATKAQHTVSGTYSPIEPIALTSTLGLAEQQEPSSGQWTDVPSASLGFAYHPLQEVDLNVTTTYSRPPNMVKAFDGNNLNGRGILSWRPYQSRLSTAMFSLETGYAAAADPNRRVQPLDNLSAILNVTLTGTTWSDLLLPSR